MGEFDQSNQTKETWAGTQEKWADAAEGAASGAISGESVGKIVEGAMWIVNAPIMAIGTAVKPFVKWLNEQQQNTVETGPVGPSAHGTRLTRPEPPPLVGRMDKGKIARGTTDATTSPEQGGIGIGKVAAAGGLAYLVGHLIGWV